MNKTLSFKLALGSLFVLSAMSASASPINQVLTTDYYNSMVLDIHASVIEEGLNQEMGVYDCLAVKLNYKIIKEAETRIFSKDTPGKVKLTYNNQCSSTDLVAMNFSVDSFGYDEDYTAVTIKLTTKSGVKMKKFCAYGLHSDVRRCPDPKIDPKAVFSIQAKAKPE